MLWALAGSLTRSEREEMRRILDLADFLGMEPVPDEPLPVAPVDAPNLVPPVVQAMVSEPVVLSDPVVDDEPPKEPEPEPARPKAKHVSVKRMKAGVTVLVVLGGSIAGVILGNELVSRL